VIVQGPAERIGEVRCHRSDTDRRAVHPFRPPHLEGKHDGLMGEEGERHALVRVIQQAPARVARTSCHLVTIWWGRAFSGKWRVTLLRWLAVETCAMRGKLHCHGMTGSEHASAAERCF
jgi:hypothetical protein